jgi:hypothetical protein
VQYAAEAGDGSLQLAEAGDGARVRSLLTAASPPAVAEAGARPQSPPYDGRWSRASSNSSNASSYGSAHDGDDVQSFESA